MNMQYNNICRWFNIIKNRNIFIFGSGIIGKRFNQFLRMFQFEICGFCDNDEKKYGDVVDGTKVYPLEVILEQYPQAYFIIANKKNADDIFNQLLKVGVNPINVFKEQESICMDVYSIIQMQIRGV